MASWSTINATPLPGTAFSPPSTRRKGDGFREGLNPSYGLRDSGLPSDLPDGRAVENPVQSPLQKYFASPVGQIISTNSCHPVPHRGAYRDRHERGMGCGGRGSVLRAMESQGGSMRPVSDYQASGREMLQRTAKSCGPDAPTLASSLAEVLSALPGSDKTLIREMTVAKEPGHRGERDIRR